jgi:hypothetical protein
MRVKLFDNIAFYTNTASLYVFENSPAVWYFFLGSGGMESRNRFISGDATETKCAPPEYGGELDRVVLLDISESLNQTQNYTSTKYLYRGYSTKKFHPTAIFFSDKLNQN